MLLTTKFFVPRPTGPLVNRHRLHDKLTANSGARLTLISAPPGFGKTTLVTEWLAALSLPHAWLSLDEQDNDPVRFFAYLVSALQRIHTAIGKSIQPLLQSPTAPNWESLCAILCNDLATLAVSAVLVLDDYHEIQSQPIHDALTFLIEHLPPTLRLIMTTRSDPPFPLARWRVRQAMVEVRVRDLRFNQAETSEFLAQQLPVTLPMDEVQNLAERSEGWIAGLQLATLSLTLHTQNDNNSFFRSFTGSDPFVVDYLVEEVFNRQPPEIQRFLLRSSLLSRFCAPLCAALYPPEEALSLSETQRIIDYLVRANLFLVPLDVEQRWFRYHHLFGDMLCARLQRFYPKQVADYHRRASAWLYEQRLPSEAIHHALAAGDHALAAECIEVESVSLLSQGQHLTLQKWLQQLPADLITTRPALALTQAEIYVIIQQLDKAEEFLRLAAAGGRTAAIGASIALNRGHYQQAVALAEEALRQLDHADPAAAEVMLHLGLASSFLGNLMAAEQAYRQATRLGETNGNLRVALLGLFNRGALYHSAGQLRRAAAQYEEAIQFTRRHEVEQMPTAAFAYQMLGDLWYEWNDYEKATHFLDEAIQRCERGRLMRMLGLAYTFRARLYHAQGDDRVAQATIDKAKQIVEQNQLSVRYAGPVMAYQVRLWLAMGNVSAAQTWAQTCELRASDEELSMVNEERYSVLARFLSAEGKLAEALSLLARFRARIASEGRMNSVIGLWALQASIQQAHGQQEQAVVALYEALILAAPEGYVRTFLDEGAAILKLLHELRFTIDDGRLGAYVERLIMAFATEEKSPTAGEGSVDSTIATPLPSLSEREIEVLRITAQGLSDRQIAEQLFLAIGTVKKHLNSIYRKLGVSGRTGALAQAIEQGLI